jgi:mono/diheme cytochrome c family protein
MASIVAGLGAAAVLAASGVLQAQGSDIGQREYAENCAVCHGTTGKGDGPMAGIINQKVTDLTQLSKNNNGAFPFAHVYEVIDGTREAKGHGTRDMPVWGSVYNQQTPQWLGYDYARADAQSFVRGRILALTGHLLTLQEK